MKRINTPQKGEYGYLAKQKKLSIIKTVLSYAIAIAVFIIGYLSAKTKENVFSIIAVLLLLPASRNTVSMIMFLKTPAYDEKLYHKLADLKGNVPMLFHLYLTSYQVNFPITCFAAKGSNLIGYTEFGKCDVNACKEHIEGIIKQNGLSNINVKIFGSNDYKMFEERIKQLQSVEPSKHDEELLALMCDISL